MSEKLPSHWIEKHSSKRPGMKYYFNLKTGASVWEHPMSNLSTSNKIKTNTKHDGNQLLREMAEMQEKLLLRVLTKSDIDAPTAVVNPIEIALCDNIKAGIKRKSESVCEDNQSFKRKNENRKFSFSSIKSAHHSNNSSNIKCVQNSNNSSHVKFSKNFNNSSNIKPVQNSSSIESIDCSKNHLTDITSSSYNIDTASIIIPTNTKNTSIEVPSDDQVSPEIVYIVVDTSVLISDSARFMKLCYELFKKVTQYRIFFPFCVPMELESIKNRTSKSLMVIKAAQDVKNFINDLITTNNEFCRFQTVSEVNRWSEKFSRNSDDTIIECVHHLTLEEPNAKIILLTNDVLLQIKGRVCKAEIHGFQSLSKLLNIDVRLSKPKWKTNLRKNKISKQVTQPKVVDEGNETEFKIKDICVILCEAEELLKNVLKQFIFEKINQATIRNFEVRDFKILKNLLHFILKHWNACFSQYFSNKAKRHFVFLQTVSNSSKNGLNILTAVEDVFCSIKRKSPHIEMPIEKIQSMRVAWVKQFSKNAFSKTNIESAEVVNKIPSDVNNITSNIVNEVFEYNLVIINTLCGLIYDFNDMPHDFLYHEPDTFPEKSDLIEVIGKLKPGVEQLKSLMCRLVDKSEKVNDEFYKQLAHFLMTFISSLNVEVEDIDMASFNEYVLRDFCIDAENQSVILKNYKKLEHFYDKLVEVMPRMLNNL